MSEGSGGGGGGGGGGGARFVTLSDSSVSTARTSLGDSKQAASLGSTALGEPSVAVHADGGAGGGWSGAGGRLEVGKGRSSNPSGTFLSSVDRKRRRLMVCVPTLLVKSWEGATLSAQVGVRVPSTARTPTRSSSAQTASLRIHNVKRLSFQIKSSSSHNLKQCKFSKYIRALGFSV